MFNVLSKLKQKVIWKWEDLEKTAGNSENILYSRWLSQDDILDNLKLFSNHAGKGGITKAQYHGKPMPSLPVFGDQPGNAFGMVKNGFGLTLSLLTLEEKPFAEAFKRSYRIQSTARRWPSSSPCIEIAPGFSDFLLIFKVLWFT
ncbi:hypothetical protein M5D96_003888 [Drosophila gunungcola]|uniref:Uncharacterized protein n=1 Tax=Drosophila gunungcola TaxID=103775 RepID=A0A9Q0BSS3_9MUSC|nr:hypothetical protein M5D96_003888 [Drosophila gunungcola]